MNLKYKKEDVNSQMDFDKLAEETDKKIKNFKVKGVNGKKLSHGEWCFIGYSALLVFLLNALSFGFAYLQMKEVFDFCLHTSQVICYGFYLVLFTWGASSYFKQRYQKTAELFLLSYGFGFFIGFSAFISTFSFAFTGAE